MRNKILAANWKMNLTLPEVELWVKKFNGFNWQSDTKEVRVYPSALFIPMLQNNFSHVGAQNFYYKPSGAFTGELSLEQLSSVGSSSVLIGHSERRELFHEDNAFITQKVKAAADKKMSFILCCGENLAQREGKTHLHFIEQQLKSALSSFDRSKLSLLCIAYEPIWAIGTGLHANAAQITEMHAFIRSLLLELFGSDASSVPILYGGSVNPENAASIFSCPEVAGALVGGASLDPHVFHQLWEQL
jgi:triosephosphate isomerase